VIGVIWIAVIIFEATGKGVDALAIWHRKQSLLSAKRANQKRLENQEKARRAEEERISKFRATHPAQIVGIPDLPALKNAVTRLNDFVAAADAYRPEFKLSFSDIQFRDVHFSLPSEFFFPRDCEGSRDGPDPQRWETTLDSLVTPRAGDLRSIYSSVIAANAFPSEAPIPTFDASPPRFPQIDLPRWEIKIVTVNTGGEIDFRVDKLRKMYATEITRVEKLKGMAKE